MDRQSVVRGIQLIFAGASWVLVGLSFLFPHYREVLLGCAVVCAAVGGVSLPNK